MNNKKFEYKSKDIPFLKKDVAYRLLFLLLFGLIFIWQFASLIVLISTKQDVSILMIIVSSMVLVFTLLYCVICCVYALKSLKIIKVVKKKGRCISSVLLIFSTKKSGFMKLYSLINIALTAISIVILVSSVTYSILQFTYLSSTSFYMPALATICLCGFNAVYHINTEIKTMNSVEQYNSIY